MYIIVLFIFFMSILIFFKYCSNIFFRCLCIFHLFNKRFIVLHINFVIIQFISFPWFFLFYFFGWRRSVLCILLRQIRELLYLISDVLGSFHWRFMIILISKLLMIFVVSKLLHVSVSLYQPQLWLRENDFVLTCVSTHVSLGSIHTLRWHILLLFNFLLFTLFDESNTLFEQKSYPQTDLLKLLEHVPDQE